MRKKKLIIERIKDIMIVVLFITAVLLLSFFWQGISFDDFSVLNLANNEENLHRPAAAELIAPDRITVNYGSGAYAVLGPDCEVSTDVDADLLNRPVKNDTGTTSVPDTADSDELYTDGAYNDNNSENSVELYDLTLAFMEIYLVCDDISVEQIEKEQYDQVMAYASLSSVFDYDIPFRDFLTNNNLSVPSGSESVENMTEISFSSASSENLFIYDGSADKYYRFVTTDEETSDYMSAEITELVNQIEQSGSTTYYTIESLAGIENDTLIPVYMESGIAEHNCSAEYSISNQSEVNKAERMFFPSGLDFVRKITENKGALLYMYGYSEKVLLLNEDGSIKYTEELDSSLYSESGFYSSLSTAIDYVTEHGGWAALYTDGMQPYMKDAEIINASDGKYRGYRFSFGVKVSGKPVEYSTHSILTIEVYGSQITLYARDAIVLDENVNDNEGSKWQAKNAIDVITDEYAEICNILAENAKSNGDTEKLQIYTAENRFENLTKQIERIRLCYFRDVENNPSLIIPVWYLEIDNSQFWFDPVTGDILGYNVGEVE